MDPNELDATNDEPETNTSEPHERFAVQDGDDVTFVDDTGSH